MKPEHKAYINVPYASTTQLPIIFAFIAGVLGIIIIAFCVVATLATSNTEYLENIILGAFFSLALIPTQFKTGSELDSKNKKFREYEGFRGKTKGDWIEVNEEDYVSIVGFSQTRTGSARGASSSITVGMSKVYFFNGNWHTEIFKGDYEDALKVSELFAKVFGIAINDVNKDQENVKTSVSGFGQ